MKEKIRNWMRDGRGYIYGFGLLCVSLCTVAFSGAYIGAKTADHDTTINITYGPKSNGD